MQEERCSCADGVATDTTAWISRCSKETSPARTTSAASRRPHRGRIPFSEAPAGIRFPPVLGLFVSLLVGAALAASVAIPQAVTSAWGIALWGVLGFLASFIYLGRRANKKLEPVLAEAQ